MFCLVSVLVNLFSGVVYSECILDRFSLCVADSELLFHV
jgi:hypothetical protein